MKAEDLAKRLRKYASFNSAPLLFTRSADMILQLDNENIILKAKNEGLQKELDYIIEAMIGDTRKAQEK
jgi:hypothetical protein